MLQAILACYTEFEERVGLMTDTGNGSTAYDIVKKYTEEKIGRFTGADVVAHCPSIGRSSVLAALKKKDLSSGKDPEEARFMFVLTANDFRTKLK